MHHIEVDLRSSDPLQARHGIRRCGAVWVTAGEVLKRVEQAARTRQFGIRRHAFVRMDQRGVTEADVRSAMMSAKDAAWDGDKQTWRLTGGTDLDGSELIVCVAIEWTVAVVTVFWE